jgi:Holliday junction resolvasome RuvABC endonuclease subunit
MSVDPGTTTVGVSLFGMNDDFVILTRESFLIDAKKETYVNRLNNITDYKLLKIRNRIKQYIYEYLPVAMAIEMPFFNVRRPQAVIPLARSLEAIMGGMTEASPYTPIIRPSPSNVKNIVGVKGNSNDKDDMTRAVMAIGLCDGDESEHEIDAIAVNVYLYELMKVNYMLPYLMR